MCLSSASPALWHWGCVASPGCVCHVCVQLTAHCHLLCLSHAFGSASPLIEMLESVLKILRLKTDASKTSWYWLATLLKTPAEAESTLWEHQVCVQHFALERTGFSFFRDSHQQWQQQTWQASAVCQIPCRNRGGTHLFKLHPCSALKLLCATVWHPCPKHFF